MKFKTKIGENFSVLDSGTIVGVHNEIISFELDKNNDFIVYFRFADRFPQTGTVQLKASIINNNSVMLDFDVFGSVAGYGNVEPIEIGVYNQRKLFLNYRIFSFPKGNIRMNMNKGGVTLMYTWLLGDVA